MSKSHPWYHDVMSRTCNKILVEIPLLRSFLWIWRINWTKRFEWITALGHAVQFRILTTCNIAWTNRTYQFHSFHTVTCVCLCYDLNSLVPPECLGFRRGRHSKVPGTTMIQSIGWFQHTYFQPQDVIFGAQDAKSCWKHLEHFVDVHPHSLQDARSEVPVGIWRQKWNQKSGGFSMQNIAKPCKTMKNYTNKTIQTVQTKNKWTFNKPFIKGCRKSAYSRLLSANMSYRQYVWCRFHQHGTNLVKFILDRTIWDHFLNTRWMDKFTWNPTCNIIFSTPWA